MDAEGFKTMIISINEVESIILLKHDAAKVFIFEENMHHSLFLDKIISLADDLHYWHDGLLDFSRSTNLRFLKSLTQSTSESLGQFDQQTTLICELWQSIDQFAYQRFNLLREALGVARDKRELQGPYKSCASVVKKILAGVQIIGLRGVREA